jgi:hypothetical protein
LVGGETNPFVDIADELGITLDKDKRNSYQGENHRFQRNGEPLNEDLRAPRQAHQRANLQHSVDERLFFAGEATVYGGQGTCHGAYQSGLRSAQEIATQLNVL